MNNNMLAYIQEHLIKRIQSTTDVSELIYIWAFLDELKVSDLITKPVFRPMLQNITLESLKKEQNFKGTDWAKADEWAKAFDMQEPIEDLLSQLTK
jgi:hypothetical protein